MLHIHDGDCSANVLRQSDLSGEHLPWREALIAGPTPQGLSQDAWQTVRANYLAEAYELQAPDCKASLFNQHQTLLTFSEHEEVVLWFEHDLFCQTILIYLLQWLQAQDLGKTELSLICINQFPGVESFRDLGQLTPHQISSLFDQRHTVTDLEMGLAVKAWQAYRSPNPKTIEDLLSQDTSTLPFLRSTFLKHLSRFPSLRNGLGRIENKALELIRVGFYEFAPLFSEFGITEPVYGYGDWQFWQDLKRLVRAREPLLSINGLEELDAAIASGSYTRACFEITEAGKAVLAGEADYVELNGLDIWLGGVYLNDPKNLWRWNEESQTLVDATIRRK